MKRFSRKRAIWAILAGFAVILVAALVFLYQTGKLKIGAEANFYGNMVKICAQILNEPRSLPNANITLTTPSGQREVYTAFNGCVDISLSERGQYEARADHPEYQQVQSVIFNNTDDYFSLTQDIVMQKIGETAEQPQADTTRVSLPGTTQLTQTQQYSTQTTDVYFKFDTQSDVWIEIYARNAVSAASPTNKLVQFFTTPAKAQDDSAAKKAEAQAEAFRKTQGTQPAQPTDANNQQTRTFMDWWNGLSKDQQTQYYQTASPQIRQVLLDNMSTSQKWKIFSKDPRNIVQLVTRSQQTNPLNAILEAAIGSGIISNPWIMLALMPGQETHTVPRTDEEGNTTQVERICDTYLLGLVKVNCRDAGTGGSTGGYNPYAYGGGYGGYGGYPSYPSNYYNFTPDNYWGNTWGGIGNSLANAVTGGATGNITTNINNAIQKKNLSEFTKDDFATETPYFSARVPANSGLLVTGIPQGFYYLRVLSTDRTKIVLEYPIEAEKGVEIQAFPAPPSAEYPQPDAAGITFKPFDEGNTTGIYVYIRDIQNQEHFLAVTDNGIVDKVAYPFKVERLKNDLAHYLRVLYSGATATTTPAALQEGIGWIESTEEKLLQASIDEMRRQAGAEGETGLTEDEIIQQLTQQGEPSPTVWGAARPSGEPTQTQGTEVKTSDYIDKCTLVQSSTDPTNWFLYARFANSIPFQILFGEQDANEVQLQWALFKYGSDASQAENAIVHHTKSGGDEVSINILGKAFPIKSNLKNIDISSVYTLYAHPPNTDTKENLLCGVQPLITQKSGATSYKGRNQTSDNATISGQVIADKIISVDIQPEKIVGSEWEAKISVHYQRPNGQSYIQEYRTIGKAETDALLQGMQLRQQRQR